MPVTPAPPSRPGLLPGERAGLEATSDEARIKARIQGTNVDLEARNRVTAGLVDPSFTRIGRAMLDAWDPERALPEDSVKMWARQRAQNALVGTQLMLETARQYAKSGSPMAAGETLDDEEVRADRRDATSAAFFSDQQRTRETFRQYMRGKFNEGRTALVYVEERADGRIDVTLHKPSGDPDVDRGALDDLRRAIERLHADAGPPARLRRTLWSLRLQIIIQPPVPIGGFTFDEVLENPKWELPLGRKLLKRIRLEAVYEPEAAP